MKTIKIGVSCSPNTYIVSHEIIKGKKLLVSFGGGIGGSSKTYFCTEVIQMRDPKEPTILRVRLLSGEVIELNPVFVVETKERDIVKVVSNVTGHRNYSKKIYREVIETEYFEMLYDEQPMFIEDYTSRHQGDLEGKTISCTEEVKY
jgi:hypothetical protein